jgi:hypothetical protein
LRDPSAPRPPLVAIGIDAFEPGLARDLMARGRLPALAALAASGTSGSLEAPAEVGSGAVWPTFSSSRPAIAHGFHSDLAWQPSRMRLTRASFGHIEPFWRRWAARDGVTSAIVDVPFVMSVATAGCAEILNWGAHDWLGDRVTTSSPVAASAAAEVGVHPFARRVAETSGLVDGRGQQRLLDDCIAGAGARGDLASRLFARTRADFRLVVFTEAHRAGHYLWPECGGDEGRARFVDAAPGPLERVMSAIDRQVARLVDEAGDDAAVFVFSLHGMRPAVGVPDLLDPVLEAWGCAVPAPRPRPRLRQLPFAALPRPLIDAARRVYHRSVPRSIVMRYAHPEKDLRAWDWARTHAFALPSDQHGWIRVNLAGREACGQVPLAAYASCCRELKERLLALRTQEGRTVVDSVSLTAGEGVSPIDLALPDLVVHWADGAHATDVRLRSPPVRSAPRAPWLRGQHGALGFYVFRGASDARSCAPPGRLRAEDLAGWFRRWVP